MRLYADYLVDEVQDVVSDYVWPKTLDSGHLDSFAENREVCWIFESCFWKGFWPPHQPDTTRPKPTLLGYQKADFYRGF